MTRYFRVIGVIALCSFLAGCSGYQQASWHTPGQIPEEEESDDRRELQSGDKVESDDRRELQSGDKVRLILATGEKIEGRFVTSNADSIEVRVVTSQYAEAGTGRETEEGVRTYPWRDIASMEYFGVKTSTTVIAILVTAAIVGFIAHGLSHGYIGFGF